MQRMKRPSEEQGRRSRVRGPIRCLIVAAFLLAGLSVVPAGATPFDEARRLVGTSWYSVSILGRRLGYAFRTTTVDEDAAGGPELRVVQKLDARVKIAGAPDELKLVSEMLTVYDSELQPRILSMKNDEFGRVREVVATLRGDCIDVVSKALGEETRKTTPVPDDFGTDMDLILGIMRGEARIGDKSEFTTYTPDADAYERQTLTITEKLTLEDGREAWKILAKTSRLPVDIATVVADDGELVSLTMPTLMQLTMAKTTKQDALSIVAPLVLSGEIPTNKKIEDPTALSVLKIRVSCSAPVTGQIVPGTLRQIVQSENGAALVTISRRGNDGPGATLPVQGDEFAQYLQPTELLQIGDPAIAAKAREIVGGETDARQAAKKIVGWVYKNMSKVKSDPRPVSAKEVLDQMSGDCTEHAVLCAALAAASGIPAKMATGIVYARGSFYYHAWNELYVGEWVEMDAAWGEMAVDAGHIQFTAGPVSNDGMTQTALAAGQTMGSLKVEILDYELADSR